MAKVRFTGEFWYRPTEHTRIRYRPSDKTYVVKKDCAEKAVAAGKAVFVEAGNGAYPKSAKAQSET